MSYWRCREEKTERPQPKWKPPPPPPPARLVSLKQFMLLAKASLIGFVSLHDSTATSAAEQSQLAQFAQLAYWPQGVIHMFVQIMQLQINMCSNCA